MILTENFQFITTKLDITAATDKSSGTGFFYVHAEQRGKESISSYFIITNRHVVENATQIIFYVNKENSTEVQRCMLTNLNAKVIYHTEKEVDLCLIAITDIYIELIKRNINLAWKFISIEMILSDRYESLIKSVENIFMVGYPIGLIDLVNNKPIVRSGITATSCVLNFCNEKVFLTDLPCLPGSSGSPVFIADNPRITKEGTLMGGINFGFLIGVQSKSYHMEGDNPYVDIGIAINYKALQELVSQIKIDNILM